MNEILHNRIEEAAANHKAYAEEFRLKSDTSFICGVDWYRNHQWISVEEALPENAELYFVAYKALDMILFSTGCYHSDKKEWYVDGYGYMYDVIHWMPIPSLKGGEK